MLFHKATKGVEVVIHSTITVLKSWKKITDMVDGLDFCLYKKNVVMQEGEWEVALPDLLSLNQWATFRIGVDRSFFQNC